MLLLIVRTSIESKLNQSFHPIRDQFTNEIPITHRRHNYKFEPVHPSQIKTSSNQSFASPLSKSILGKDNRLVYHKKVTEPCETDAAKTTLQPDVNIVAKIRPSLQNLKSHEVDELAAEISRDG
ncbi:hypothetical protein WA026_000337 [Henosepilachna vigintioctopunctata]|uniref:Uncharacterized protein n=1 Tax=Henosepilachna vigintioctopunctata TaxID=420089 RepID=A0AAW1V7A5_9CUCU